MGTLSHHAIIITSWNSDSVEKAHIQAKEMFGSIGCFQGKSDRLVSDIIYGIANNQASFFIAPDGSKESWNASDECDKVRKDYLDWLRWKSNLYCNYIEVEFGGDHHIDTIVRTDRSDLDNEEIEY